MIQCLNRYQDMLTKSMHQTYAFITRPAKLKMVMVSMLLVSLQFLAAQKSTASSFDTSYKNVESIAILGDSLSTGAGTHGNISFDSKIIWDIFDGKLPIKPKYSSEIKERLNLSASVSSPKSPTVLWRAIREYQTGIDWVGTHSVQAVSRVFLNTEEYSWGYFLGLKLNVEPQNIIFAAENGSKMMNIRAHADRVLDHGKGKLPQVVGIMYNGNDICAQNYDFMTREELFENQLFNGLNYLITNGVPHPKGTTIVIPAFINVSQLVNDKELLAKTVNAHGSPATCETLRKERFLTNIHKLNKRKDINPYAAMFSQYLPPNPASICPTIFGPTAGKDENLTKLAVQIRLYRRAQKNAIERAEEVIRRKAKGKITIKMIDATGKWKLKPKDIGADCFHLSQEGQLALAEMIETGIKAVSK